MLHFKSMLLTGVLFLGLATSGYSEDGGCEGKLRLTSEALQLALEEKGELIRQLAAQKQPSLTAADLNVRMVARLREIAAEVRGQRQAMNEFQGYVTWMSGSIAGYSKYIEAGSMVAGFAKALPIPYAGQAGTFTKFVSHFTLSLSSASKSITTYMATSQQFLERMDSLDRQPGQDLAIAELTRFADEQLIREMTGLQAKLAKTSEFSASALSFMESLNQYAASSDEYWAKAKSLVRKGDQERKEKSFLAESVASARNKADGFNARLQGYDESVTKSVPLIKSLGSYSELLAFLKWRQAEEGQPVSVPDPAKTLPAPPQ